MNDLIFISLPLICSFKHELVGYSEIDKFAIKIFNANHNK